MLSWLENIVKSGIVRMQRMTTRARIACTHMSGSPHTQRFAKSTRGRIAALLRVGPMTIDQLAARLKLTNNAVRAQVTRLEEDGVVRKVGALATASKPSATYALTRAAESRYSQLYVPLLAHLLHVLDARMTPKQFDALMRRVGRSLLGGRAAAEGTIAERARAASKLLNQFGGLTRVEKSNGHYVVRSHDCPLSAATERHPETCNAVESLLSEFSGLFVTTCCERGERMRCCFEMATKR
jgi:predicted ArsR family transcriptional regulator